MSKGGSTFNISSFQGALNNENTINHTVSNASNANYVGQQVITGEASKKYAEKVSRDNEAKRTAVVQPTKYQSKIPVKSPPKPS